MLISLLIFTQIIYIAAEVYNESEFSISDQNYSQHIWHSYNFNTGTGNREGLHFSKIGLDKNFASANGVLMWKSLEVQEKVAVFGLGTDYLLVTEFVKDVNPHTYRKDLKYTPTGLSLFKKWNAKIQRYKSFAVVSVQTTEDKHFLKWYQIYDGHLEFLWDWPFHRIITHMDVIKVNNELKLLIVSHKNGTEKNPSADIYSFNVDFYLDIWLFEKILLDEIPSSVSAFDNNDNCFFSAAFPSTEMIHVFRYTKSLCLETPEQKHFILHQKIKSAGLKTLTSFRVGFQWYLAAAGTHSSIYHIKDDLLFYPLTNLNLGNQKNWLVVPIDTYREDVMLLLDSGSDLSIVTWTGDENIQVVGSFILLACEGDIYCFEKMNKVSLQQSTAFYFDSHQYILISTKTGNPLLFKLLVKLKSLPDKVMVKLNEISQMKAALEEDFEKQSKLIKKMSAVKSENFNEGLGEMKSRENLEILSNTKDIVPDVSVLKTTVNLLTLDVEKLKSYLKSNISAYSEESRGFLPENVTDGITFYGQVFIDELNLETVNGHDVNHLLKDTFRKNKGQKIGGKKTIRDIKVENVLFEKIGEILACDVVFSDDFWGEDEKNIINGDIVWNGDLDLLKDFRYLSDNDSNISPSKTFHARKHFESLNFEELEITEKTYIQESFNSQPFILPIHSGHLNIHYLDFVNQARVEQANVKDDLDVEFINGKNFTEFLEELFLRNGERKQYNSTKVVGMFSAAALEAKKINSFDLDSDITTEDLPDSYGSDTYITDNYLKIGRGKSVRRNIYVFQNAVINGDLITEKLNNMSWMVLNDTIKKTEQNPWLTGVKDFRNLLKSNKVNLKGTINGRFAENVLSNFLDQAVRYPLFFEEVEFKNLSLNGLWDDVNVNALEESLVRLSRPGVYASNLTFEDGCVLFSNNLNVSEYVNDVSLKSENSEDLNNAPFGDDSDLPFVKARKVIVHGSLITNDKINSINLTDFNFRRISMNTPQIIPHNVFLRNITINGNISVNTLNNNDVSSIINSSGDINLIDMFLNGQINHIKKLMIKGNVTTSQGINGYNLEEIFDNAVCIKKPSNFSGNITFENMIHFDNINVTGLVNGFSLKKLEKDIVFKHSHVFLSGPKNFTTVKVAKNMKARSLNGHLIQDIASIKGDQSMKGLVIVNGNVIVKGNVTSYGKLNDISVSDLLRKFSTKYNAFVVTGDLFLNDDLVMIDNLLVGSRIQNNPFNSLIQDLILKDGSFNITGKKSFKGEVKFKETLIVKNKLNSLNFTKFLQDVVFINQPTKFRGKIIIEEAVLKELDVTNYFNSSLINNFDINDWFEDSVPLDRYEIINGKKNFEQAHAFQDVKVDFINGHLPSATITLKDKQNIPVIGLFSRITTSSDFPVARFVNGKNLMEEYEDSVLLTGDQAIVGRILFEKDFTVVGNLFIESLKGKKVNDLITLNTKQNIETPLEFLGSVTVRQTVEDLAVISDINLDEWYQNSVSLNKNQELTGLWTVRGKVKAKKIKGNGLLDKINLAGISRDVQRSKEMAIEMKNYTEYEFQNHCQKIKDLSKQFAHLPYLFQQFEFLEEIETSSVIESVITFKISEINYLAITFQNECLSMLYKWSKNSATFLFLRQMNIGPVSKWSVSYQNNITYLITTSQNSDISCEENLQQGNIWAFEGDSEKYVHLLSTNGFVDIAHENSTCGKFFTLEERGDIYEWDLSGNVSSKLIFNVGQGNYRFIDFKAAEGLAVSNGKEIKQINLKDDKLILSTLSFSNAHIVALPMVNKTFIAFILKDKIVVYENIIEEKIFSVIHTYRAGSVLWLNYGPNRQAFLIIASHHKLIEVYEYKGVSGLVKKLSIPMFSSHLQLVELPFDEKHQLSKVVIVIQKKKVIFLKAHMMGDYYEEKEIFC